VAPSVGVVPARGRQLNGQFGRVRPFGVCPGPGARLGPDLATPTATPTSEAPAACIAQESLGGD